MRKLFGTDGVRGVANTYPITPEVIMKLGKAAALVLRNCKKRPKIVIGKDTRLSGYMIETALTSGILSVGGDVLLVGPMPTPAVAHLVKSFAADAGIVISASHNPAQDNGIKFFSNQGLKLSDETEKKIEDLFFSNKISTDKINGEKIGKAYRIDDARGRYIEFAKSSIHNNSLKGLKVVLDCANGAAYNITPLILEELGAEVITLNNKPNGLNINLNCGALHPNIISKEVLKQKADVGVALDGDADRIIMVDENGKIVDGDEIMAIAALDMIKKGELKNNTLIATYYSNLGLDKTIKEAGGKVIRVKNGDRYVIDEMLKKRYNFGGEQSGHIIFFDYSTTGDGTIAALKMLDIMKQNNKKLSQLAKCLNKFPQILVNIKVKEKKDLKKIPPLYKAIDKANKELGKNGRTLIRYSGTQNILRIMMEGKDKKLITKLASDIANKAKKAIGA
ncbi:phosphoglucosamine mutase [Candidatus Woesearchaeota archaeon RBG_13_36_6]|nr:MAG: phosphoglucosamine mutase [Candidatus Woesearchaeota archaeon RBG_13_36_6]